MADTDHPSWQPCVKVPIKTCLRRDHCMGSVCERLRADPDRHELLTVEEKEVLEQLGNLYTSLFAIIGNSSSGDQQEMISHIHDLQRMVMSQAAARRYPDLYRKLGGGLT